MVLATSPVTHSKLGGSRSATRICVVSLLPRFCKVSANCTGWLMLTGLAVMRCLVSDRSVLGKMTLLTCAMLLFVPPLLLKVQAPADS